MKGPGCISSSCNKGGDLKSCDSSNSKGGECGSEPSDFELSSQYRGVSYDKMKRKWRVQIRVANLGRSGVSVGYFNTELEAARAYDRAAIGLLGQNAVITNFPATDYPKQEVAVCRSANPHSSTSSRNSLPLSTFPTPRASSAALCSRRCAYQALTSHVLLLPTQFATDCFPRFSSCLASAGKR